jgi:DNA-binding response OmpR family regulator
MKKILIIDDDPKIVAALGIRFQADGYATDSCGDAATGLSKAVQGQPDLILLDISLPAGDGLQLGRKLGELAETRSIPVVFVTANKDPDLRAKVMDLEAAGLFEKPYNAEELLAVAAHALGDTCQFRRPVPSSEPEAEPEQEVTLPQLNEVDAKKILIIEDDDKIARALALRLKSAGYDTTIASDALTGVNVAVRVQPDLLLLDVSMPAGNGFTVAERVQDLLPSPPPLIFLTASKQPGLRERAERLGAAGYFEKPYEADQLLHAVHQQIGI